MSAATLPLAGSTSCACAPRAGCPGPLREGCEGRVPGIDAQRTCDPCQAAGAPVLVPWSEVRPPLCQRQLCACGGSHTDGELTIVLKNAGLSEAAVKGPKKKRAAKDDVGSFEKVA